MMSPSEDVNKISPPEPQAKFSEKEIARRQLLANKICGLIENFTPSEALDSIAWAAVAAIRCAHTSPEMMENNKKAFMAAVDKALANSLKASEEAAKRAAGEK